MLDEFFGGGECLGLQLEGPLVGVDDVARVEDLDEEVEGQVVVQGGIELAMCVERFVAVLADPDPVVAVPVERHGHGRFADLLIGYEPVTSFRKGLDKSIDWYRQNLA